MKQFKKSLLEFTEQALVISKNESGILKGGVIDIHASILKPTITGDNSVCDNTGSGGCAGHNRDSCMNGGVCTNSSPCFA